MDPVQGAILDDLGNERACLGEVFVVGAWNGHMGEMHVLRLLLCLGTATHDDFGEHAGGVLIDEGLWNQHNSPPTDLIFRVKHVPMRKLKGYSVKCILFQIGNDAFRTQKCVTAKVVHALSVSRRLQMFSKYARLNCAISSLKNTIGDACLFYGRWNCG